MFKKVRKEKITYLNSGLGKKIACSNLNTQLDFVTAASMFIDSLVFYAKYKTSDTEHVHPNLMQIFYQYFSLINITTSVFKYSIFL